MAVKDMGASADSEEVTNNHLEEPRNNIGSSDSLKGTNGADVSAEEHRKRWPESSEREGSIFCRIAGLCDAWFYSYMWEILRKGRRQFKDGKHLSQEDLFEVPDEMRSRNLVDDFWSVNSSGAFVLCAFSQFFLLRQEIAR